MNDFGHVNFEISWLSTSELWGNFKSFSVVIQHAHHNQNSLTLGEFISHEGMNIYPPSPIIIW